MKEVTIEQIRAFRLHSHHLDRYDSKDALYEIVGACGLQNTPPGSWEIALHQRIKELSAADMRFLLYHDKSLLQAWSIRGVPLIFPTKQSDTFLSAFIAKEQEPWIYTRGITLALDALQMSFDELFMIMKQVMPRLNDVRIISKRELDQTIAEWMLPLIPKEKQAIWNHASMYDPSQKQSIGGAVVSFLLRPCSFLGLVVFGERLGNCPTFTSYQSWIGQDIPCTFDAEKKLLRKYLHTYGPATIDTFISWMGCSSLQGNRIWNDMMDEMEAIQVMGKKAYMLRQDINELVSSMPIEREWILLAGHDPYLDQRDRSILQADKKLQKRIWRTTTNPGAILYRGEIVGIWTRKKNAKGIEIKLELWKMESDMKILSQLVENLACFQEEKLLKLIIEEK